MFPFAEMDLAIFDHMLYLVLNPLVYLAVIMMIFQYQRAVNNERKIHSVRVTSVTEQTLLSLGYGILIGVLASVASVSLKVTLSVYDALYIWIVAVLIIVIRNRFVCFPYITGMLGIIAFVSKMWKQGSEFPVLGTIWEGIGYLNMASIIAVIAILQIAEAILIWLDGGNKASPIFVKSKRGQLVGAFHIQKMWLLPLFVFIASQPGTTIELSPLAGIVLGIFPLPVVLGYGDLAISRTPKQKSRQTAGLLMIYAGVLFTFAYTVNYSPWILLSASVFVIGAYEAIVMIGRRNEMLERALYSRPERGMRILAVLRDSTAAKLGLQSGEVVMKVNGVEVNDQTELYDAVASQPVYVKMEVENLHKEIKFLQTPLYQGEHHSFGIIFVPDDEQATKYMKIGD